MKLFSRLLYFLTLAVIAASCTYDNIDEFYSAEFCDTLNVTYDQTVKPILSRNCLGCHSTNSSLSDVILDSYEDVKIYVDDGSFLGSIKHLNGYTPMPRGRAKLDACTIAKIEKWINEGAQNN